MTEANKRMVPPIIRKILDTDVIITNNFVLWANEILPLRTLRTHYRALEISCHGIPWFAFWICFTWLFNNPHLVQMQVNMLLGLFLDIIFVAVIKAYTRRRRPVANTDDALGQVGPDVFSFPSGHASRAVFAAAFFINLHPVNMLFWLPLIAWATAVCMSRILMQRHHILDVMAGVILGLLEAWLMGLLWISEESSKDLMWYLSDEKLDGGDYHV